MDIITAAPTKKYLMELVEHINKNRDEPGFHVENEPILCDPSVVRAKRNGEAIFLSQVKSGEEWFVTNHPKRSYYAKIVRLLNDNLKVT